MGLWRDLTERGENAGQKRIDNTPEAVRRRLEYLRQPLGRGDLLPADVVETPRRITYTVAAVEYAMTRMFTDSAHYQYGEEEKSAILRNPEYYTSAGTVGDVVSRMWARHEMYFDTAPTPGRYQTIIPYTREPVKDGLELPEKAWVQLARPDRDGYLDFCICAALRRDSWRKGGFDCGDSDEGCGYYTNPAEPSFRFFYFIEVDVRINNVSADKCNLTYTERARIIRGIRDQRMAGEFLSDGKELTKDAPECFRSYESKRSESLNFAMWYGLRGEKAERYKSSGMFARL